MGRLLTSFLLVLALVATALAQSMIITSNTVPSNYPITTNSKKPVPTNMIYMAKAVNSYYGGFTAVASFGGYNFFATANGVYATTWDQYPGSPSITGIYDISQQTNGYASGSPYPNPNYLGVFGFNTVNGNAYYAAETAFCGWPYAQSTSLPSMNCLNGGGGGSGTSLAPGQYFTAMATMSTGSCDALTLIYTSAGGTSTWIVSFADMGWYYNNVPANANQGQLLTSASSCYTIIQNGNNYYITCTGLVLVQQVSTSQLDYWTTCAYLAPSGFTSYPTGAGSLTTGVMGPNNYLYLGSSLGLAFEIDTTTFSINRVALLFSVTSGGLAAFRSVLLDYNNGVPALYWGSLDGQVARVNLRTFTVFSTASTGTGEDMVQMYPGLTSFPGYFYVAGAPFKEGTATSTFHSYRIQQSNCAIYTCATCYASPTDVEYCGWCSDTQTCTNSASCGSSYWTPGTTSGGICPALSSLSINNGSIAGGTTVVLYGTTFSTSGTYRCNWGGQSNSATSVTTGSITCVSPSVSSAQTVALSVSSKTSTGAWANYAGPLNFTYYDCRNIPTCASCVQSAAYQECGWCFGTGTCASSPATTNTGSCASSNNWMTSCPSVGVVAPTSMSVITAATATVSVSTNNFPPTLSKSSVSCAYYTTSGTSSGSAAATAVSGSSVTCSVANGVITATDAASGSAYFNVQLTAATGPVTYAPPSTGSFQVYDCTLLTACFDCNSHSDCTWCYNNNTGSTSCQAMGQTCPTGAAPSTACADLNSVLPTYVSTAQAGTTTVALTGTNLNSTSANLTKCYWNLGALPQYNSAMTTQNAFAATCQIPPGVAGQVGNWSISLGNYLTRQTSSSNLDIYSCASFNDCSSCLAVDNACNWCLLPGGPGCLNSSSSTSCTGSSGSALLTARGVCPTATSVTPTTLPTIGGTVVLSGVFMLGPSNYSQLTCNWTSSVSESTPITSFNATTGQVVCAAPGGTVGAATVFLASNNSADAYTNSVSFSYASCSQFADCNSCLTSTSFCYWCGASCTESCTTSMAAKEGQCPNVTSVSPLYSVTGGGELITISGNYFLTSSSKRDEVAIATQIAGRGIAAKLTKSKRSAPYVCDFGGGFQSAGSVDSTGQNIYCTTPAKPALAVGTLESSQLNILYNGNLYLTTTGISYFSCYTFPGVSSCLSQCFYNSSDYCGWCVAGNTCGSLSQCVSAENGTSTPVWQNPQCITPTISPSLLPLKGNIPVTISLMSSLPETVKSTQLACKIGGFVSNVTAFTAGNASAVNSTSYASVTCTAPAVTAAQQVAFSVTYLGNDLFAPEQVSYVDCAIYSSQCTRCLSISYCGWCGSSCSMQVECPSGWSKKCPIDTLAIGLGVGIGGAAFLALLALMVFLIRRARRKGGLVIALREPNYVEIAWGPDVALAWKVPSDNYLLLEKHLNRRDFIMQLAIAFNCPPTEQESLAKSLVYIAHAYGFGAEMIQTCIRYEVSSCLHENTLFRNNSVASKMYKFFSRIVGIKYLFSCIARVILELEVLGREQQQAASQDPNAAREVSLLTMSMELDQTKQLGDDIDTDTNLLQLQLICQKLLNVLIKTSVNNIPPPFRKIFIEIDTSVMAKFQSNDAVYKGVGGLFFLRFVCPAITAPHVYGLLETPPNTATQRQLVLISKVIQNIANMQEPGKKEEYMVALNQFIVQSIPKIIKFYDNLRQAVNLSEEPTEDSLVMVVPEEVRLNALAATWNFLHNEKNKIRAWADQADCPLDPMQREDILTILGECEEAYPSAPKKIKTADPGAAGTSGGDRKKKKKPKEST